MTAKVIQLRERDVLAQVKNLLQIHKNRGNLVFRRLNVGAKLRNVRGQAIFTANTEMVGLPDLLVWIKNGPVLCWEVKAPRGKLSEGQLGFQDEIYGVNHAYDVIRSLDEAIAILKSYGL
jgi:hypothetical protein